MPFRASPRRRVNLGDQGPRQSGRIPRRLAPVLSALAAILVVLGIGVVLSAPVTAAAGDNPPRQRMPAAPTYPPTPTPIVNQNIDAVTYQINPSHSGMSRTRVVLPLTQIWTTTLAGSVSYPLIVGGRAFVTTTNGIYKGTLLYALDAKTGQNLWGPTTISSSLPYSAAAYDAGSVFVIDSDGLLQAFDARTGNLLWATYLAPQTMFTSPPTALQGTVYVTGSGLDGTLYAVAESTGQVLWQQTIASGDHTSPALSADGVFVSSSCVNVSKFARLTGVLDWSYSACGPGGGGRTPAYYQGNVYVRDFVNGADDVFSARSGQLLASYPAWSNAPIPAFWQSDWFALNGSTLTAQDVSSGATIWSFQGDGYLGTAPIVVDGQLFIGSTKGNLYALSATGTSPQVLWQTSLGVGISAPNELDPVPLAGIGAGQGILVVPAGSQLFAFAGASPTPTP